VRILSLPTLRTFYERPEYADSKEALLTWHGHVIKAKWQTPADVKADFGTASILKDGRVVFDIAGNKYRLVLNRVRPLTLPMIWKLHKGLGIPAEALIQPPKVSASL